MSRAATLPLIGLLVVAPWPAAADEDALPRGTVVLARSGASFVAIPVEIGWLKLYDRDAYPLRIETFGEIHGQLRVSDRSTCVVQTQRTTTGHLSEQTLTPGSEMDFVGDLVTVEDPCELEIRIRKDAHNAEN